MERKGISGADIFVSGGLAFPPGRGAQLDQYPWHWAAGRAWRSEGRGTWVHPDSAQNAIDASQLEERGSLVVAV